MHLLQIFVLFKTINCFIMYEHFPFFELNKDVLLFEGRVLSAESPESSMPRFQSCIHVAVSLILVCITSGTSYFV